MKKQSSQRRKTPKTTAKKSAGSQNSSRFSLPPRIVQLIAYCMIGVAAIASWFITPIPIAAGISILAVVRVVITLREARREANQAGSCESRGICSV